MRPLSESAARVSGQCFERKYIALGRIVKQWPSIMGESLADKATPVKLHYRKGAKGKKPQVSLDIATSDSFATVLKMRTGLILERINQIFGEDWVSAVRFVNIPANVDAVKPKRAKRPLTPDEKKTLSDVLNAVDDADIQNRLSSLGEAILTDR